MNGLDKVELQMLEALNKKGAVTKKRYIDSKKYLKELIKKLYFEL